MTYPALVVLFGLGLVAAALPAAAQDGGPIRTGEHPDFTRVVLNVAPTTEWSLETRDGAATLFFPARAIAFSTEGVFERIPRTRVTEIRSETTPRGTQVDVTVNCDCRITASFVGGRFLALDVTDRDADVVRAATDPAATDLGAPDAAREAATAAAPAAPVGAESAAIAALTPEAAAALAEARQRAREAEAVGTVETALLEQIGRAAEQGLVRLAPGTPLPQADRPAVAERAVEAPAPDTETETAAAVPAPAPEPAPAPLAADLALAPEAPAPAAPAQAPAMAVAEPLDPDADIILPPVTGPRPRQTAFEPLSLAELALIEQIDAITVFDRDTAALRARKPKMPLPEVCVEDERLDVGHWTNGLPLHAQTPQLMSRIVGEFDRPDPKAVRDLARLYIRFGFGMEAERLLADFDVAFEDRALLLDLARTVEGRPVSPDGPLAVTEACPGQHGLWLALGGGAPAYHDPSHFETVQAAFAEMPVDLRGLLGPALVTRLIEADRPAEARLIQVTMTRAGALPSVERDLAEARLLVAEGKIEAAVAALVTIAESPAHNALEALAHLTRLAVDEGIEVPERLVSDLQAAVRQQRGGPREAEFRGLLVEALAGRGALGEAVEEVRRAQAELPEAAEDFAALGQAVLAAAEPEWVGAAAYADTVLNATDLIAPSPEADAARAAIAERLIDVGLPNAALTLLDPPLARADAESRVLAARARLSLDEPEAALALLEGVDGFPALNLRAAALARAGDPEAAMALLESAGDEAAADYAWSSGAWERVRDTPDEDPARLAMAAFMARRAAPDAPAVDGAAAEELTPEAAFEAPLPSLEAPSLGASRSLLAAGREVTAFLGTVLGQE